LLEYQDVFSKDKNDLGRTGLIKHKIDVGTNAPIKQPPRIPPLAKREEALKEIKNMVAPGVRGLQQSIGFSCCFGLEERWKYSFLRGLQET
jgi:hypothetical protein